jgi:glycosyltransferase involved in cell wall biosynthesis
VSAELRTPWKRKSRPLRVLHVAWGHPPEFLWCGPVKYVHTLAIAQRAAGADARAVCASEERIEGAPPHTPRPAEFEGVPYVHLCNGRDRTIDLWDPSREMHDPDLDRTLGVLLSDMSPDVVHIQNFAGLSFEMVGAARQSGAAVVASLHNYTPVCSRDDLFFSDAERCGGPLERSCSRCLGSMAGDELYLERLRVSLAALNQCDLLLAVSRRVAEIYGEQGVSEELMRVERIGSLTAERLWQTQGSARVARAAEGEHELRGDRPLRVAFFGTLVPRKGARVLLGALPRTSNPRSIELHFHGGHGPEEERILWWFRENHPELWPSLHLHGGYWQEDLGDLLGKADIAALPPRWEDNGPQTVMEALGAGLPVVASRVGGIPDFVEEGINGLLFPEGDAKALADLLDRLVADPTLVTRLRAGIRGPYTLEEHRLALDEYYAEALARRGRPRARLGLA